MADQSQQKKVKVTAGVNPVIAAVTGVVVGASVAIAGAVALNDEKNRQKVKKILVDVKDQVIGHVEDMKNQEQDKKGGVEEKIAVSKEKVKNAADSAKNSLDQDAKDVKKVVKKSIKRGL